MAHAGALLGLVVDDVVIDDIGCVAKTMPEFVQLWTQMLADSDAASDVPDRPPSDSEPRPRPAHGVTSRGLRTDEHEAFERPRRRTRPRTKDRPDYSGAEIATVITVDRGRYRTLIDDREVIATKARQLGRASVIVGDRVRVVGDTTGEAGTLARIVEVEERRTVLRRTADDDDPYERPIVANADQLVIVTALADPPPRTGHDRPDPGGRLRRGPGSAALPDQGRPGRSGRPGRAVRPARRPDRGDPTGRRPDRAAAASWTAGTASSSVTPASASRRWSTP